MFVRSRLDRFEDSLRCNTEARAIAEKIVATAPTSANAEAITPSKVPEKRRRGDSEEK